MLHVTIASCRGKHCDFTSERRWKQEPHPVIFPDSFPSESLSSWCLTPANTSLCPFCTLPFTHTPFFTQRDKYLPLSFFSLYLVTALYFSLNLRGHLVLSPQPQSVCSIFALWIHLTRLIDWTSDRYKLLILIGIVGRGWVQCSLWADEQAFSLYFFPSMAAHLANRKDSW